MPRCPQGAGQLCSCRVNGFLRKIFALKLARRCSSFQRIRGLLRAFRKIRPWPSAILPPMKERGLQSCSRQQSGRGTGHLVPPLSRPLLAGTLGLRISACELHGSSHPPFVSISIRNCTVSAPFLRHELKFNNFTKQGMVKFCQCRKQQSISKLLLQPWLENLLLVKKR
jgi:hypothetical protein